MLSYCCHRFGWYVPAYVTESKWMESHFLVDHWKALQLEEIAGLFSLRGDLGLLKHYLTLKEPGNSETFCDDFYDNCHSGFLTGPKCHHHHDRVHGKCAVLLASYPSMLSQFVSGELLLIAGKVFLVFKYLTLY